MSWSRWLRRFLDGLILLLVSWLLLAAAYVSLGRQFVPALGDYQSELVQRIEQETGRAIDLDSLSAEMQGSQPVLQLRGLRVYEKADRDSPVLLDLQHVTARIDVFASLWQRKPVMDALQLEGLELEFIEDAEGRWQLSGLGQTRSDGDGLDKALERLFDQRRITLLDSSIRISPWEQPDWEFTNGDLTLINRGSRHRLDARLSLPDQQVVSLQLEGKLPGRDWRRADLRFFVDLPPSDWQRWIPEEQLRQLHVARVEAGGQFWGRFHQRRLGSFSGQLQAPVVALDLPGEVPPLEDVQLQFEMTLGDDEQRLDVQNLGLRLGEQRWPETRLQLTRHPRWHTWQARIDRLQLDLLGQWLPSVITHERTAEIIRSLEPGGELRNVLVSGAGLDRFRDWTLQAALHEGRVAARTVTPAMSGISGVVAGSPAMGELWVNSADWSMHLPNLFPEPWHYQSLQGAVRWRWDDEHGVRIDIPGAEARGEDGRVNALMHLHLPLQGRTPSMTLRVALRDGLADIYRRYLPSRTAALGDELEQWLEAADFSGQVPLAIFAWDGSLRREATEQERTIELYAQLEQGRFNFQPGWPALEQVDARLWQRNHDMQISGATGQLRQTRLDDVRVELDRAGEDKDAGYRLSIAGQLDGPLEDGLHIMQQTPLAEYTGDPLADWSGRGRLQGGLELGIPIGLPEGQPRRLDVQLDLQAEAEELNIAQLKAPLRNASGRFRYQHGQGLSSEAISARFLGQTVKGSLEARDGRHRLRMNGTHSTDNLYGWALLAPVPKGLATGRAAWNAELTIGGRTPRLTVESDLQGLALKLPGELEKPAESLMPSRLQLDMGPTLNWQFQLGDTLRGVLNSREDMLAGDIRYRRGLPERPAVEGIMVHARFDRIELEQWREWWEHSGLGGTAATGGAAEGKSAPRTGLINSVHVQTDHLSGFGLDLQDIEVLAMPQSGDWVMSTDHPQLSGLVRLPSAEGEPVILDLQRLTLPRREQQIADTQGLIKPLVPEDPLRGVRPGQVPAMQVSIDQLVWGPDPVGAVAFNMTPEAGALRISDIDMDLRGGLRLQGSMRWDESRSRFDGTLSAGDIARVLSAWNYAPTLSSSRFNAQVGLDWPGSPAWFALSRSSGALAVKAEDGALQSGESSADALRVFGLLNFNALTRRLRLDFSDLFGKGVAYDTFSGEAALTDGLLQTMSPLAMDGPSAKLQLDGTLDLASDRVDMGLLVTLPVTNNLPLAAIIAGAPQIGGVLFLVDRILGDKVARFASVRYRISGSWMQPTVEFDRAFDDKAALED